MKTLTVVIPFYNEENTLKKSIIKVLDAGVGDEIIFSSVEFKIRTVRITKEIMKKNRLVVEVNERVNFLDEVVISPENTEKFLDLKEEEFKKVDYVDDKSTAIENEIIRKNRLCLLNQLKIIMHEVAIFSEIENDN